MSFRLAAAVGLLLLTPLPARAVQVVDWEFGPKQQVDKPAPPGG